MKKITITKFFLFFSLILITTNCATEEIGSENAQASAQAKVWFDNNKSNYTETVLKFVNEMQWENSIVSNGEIGEVIEVPFTLTDNLSTTNKEADVFNDHHRLMFVKDKNEEFKLFYVQIFSNDKNYDILDAHYNYYNIKDNFDGEIYVQELSTKTGNRLEFRNGSRRTSSLTAKMREQACLYYGYWNGDGSFTPLYEVACYGGGGGPSEDDPRAYGGGGGGGSSSGGNVPKTVSEIIVEHINGDKLDACTKAVLEKLKNLNQNDIKAMIDRFNSGGAAFNLNMSTGAVSRSINLAETTKVSGSSTDVNMVFSDNYIYGNDNINPPTDLSVATTMTHEIIHAYMISQLEEYKSGGCAGLCDFPTVYEAYIQYEITKNPRMLPETHHELIAENYVNAIASTIEEFHTGQPVSSGFPKQVYLDMAWGGLQDTYIFNKTYPDDPNHKNYKDRERIIARINAERLGSQYGVNTPIGTPCKK